MNETLKAAGKKILKDLIVNCTDDQQLLFKRMYAHKNLGISIFDAIDQMEDNKIDWAISQVETTIKGNIPKVGDRVRSIIVPNSPVWTIEAIKDSIVWFKETVETDNLSNLIKVKIKKLYLSVEDEVPMMEEVERYWKEGDIVLNGSGDHYILVGRKQMRKVEEFEVTYNIQVGDKTFYVTDGHGSSVFDLEDPHIINSFYFDDSWQEFGAKTSHGYGRKDNYFKIIGPANQ